MERFEKEIQDARKIMYKMGFGDDGVHKAISEWKKKYIAYEWFFEGELRKKIKVPFFHDQPEKNRTLKKLVNLAKQYYVPEGDNRYYFQDIIDFTESLTDENIETGLKDGMKINKHMKKIIENITVGHKAYHLDFLTKFQNTYSEVKNVVTYSKVEEMYISIDPVDLLTISDASNWRSCHACNGEHFVGNAYIMGSPFSFVAYVEDKNFKGITQYDSCDECDSGDCEEYEIGGGIFMCPHMFPWGRPKKWRMLFQLNDNAIMFNTQYPLSYSTESIYREIKKALKVKHFDTELNNGNYSYNIAAAYFDPAEVKNIFIKEGYRDSVDFIFDKCYECGMTYTSGDNAALCDGGCSSYVECYHCRYEFDKSEVIEVNGSFYCDQCYRREFQCISCDSYSETSARVITDDGEIDYLNVCDDCLDEKYNRYKDKRGVSFYIKKPDFFHWNENILLLHSDCRDEILNDEDYLKIISEKLNMLFSTKEVV